MKETSARRGVPLAHPWLRHLRLAFNLLLSPIYFWGVLLAEGSLRSADFWLGYLSLHLFLYGGTTAFNSYYDRDTGPIGGMLRPPPVDRGLLPFSLAVQALGLPLALSVNQPFAAGWVLLFLIFTAYSHPRVRLKANPWWALAAIGLGQGALGFALGWLAVRPRPASLVSAEALLGMGTTALIVLGLYLVTQSYQTAEDRSRGDFTLPVLIGPRRALFLALAVLAVGGLAMLALALPRFGPAWSLGLALAFAALGLALARWASGFDEAEVERNFTTAMRLTQASSGFLSLFLLYHLL